MRSTIAVLAALLAAGGCVAEIDSSDKYAGATEDLSIGGYASGRACTTTVARGLTEQLVAEANCIQPGIFRNIGGIPGVELTSAARAAPYLHETAAAALERAVRGRSGTLTVTSALRTLPQQYLLYRWAGRCAGVRTAARPGSSNHETGLAIDVASSDLSAFRSALGAQGFAWFGSRDPVHFDFRGASSLTGLSIRAFQRLWNRNHPEDRISEDGVYGADTEARLRRTPAEGFAIGASCGSDAGTSEPRGGSDPECATGLTCADCNAIAYFCGFCASTGTCMQGDADGPWEGSCGEWQWIRPSACPPPPEP